MMALMKIAVIVEMAIKIRANGTQLREPDTEITGVGCGVPALMVMILLGPQAFDSLGR
jgi:hypothetical protein